MFFLKGKARLTFIGLLFLIFFGLSSASASAYDFGAFFSKIKNNFWKKVSIDLNLSRATTAPTPAPFPTPFQTTVGEEEYVMGPLGNYEGLDSLFFTVPTSNGVRGFSAHEKTLSYFGSTLENIKLEGTALDKGEQGKFDDCGAWLSSAYKLTETHWIGWYHA